MQNNIESEINTQSALLEARIDVANTSIEQQGEAIDALQTETEEINNKIEDSGWITATLASNFQPYNNTAANIPKYRKIGDVVEIRGTVTPTETIEASNDATPILNLPSGYRPSGIARYFICQGSQKNVFLLTIQTSGNVGISRYGTTTNIDIPTLAWLPFSATFII